MRLLLIHSAWGVDVFAHACVWMCVEAKGVIPQEPFTLLCEAWSLTET